MTLKSKIHAHDSLQVVLVNMFTLDIISHLCQVFHETEDKQKIKLEDGQDINCVAGKTISGLSKGMLHLFSMCSFRVCTLNPRNK